MKLLTLLLTKPRSTGKNLLQISRWRQCDALFRCFQMERKTLGAHLPIQAKLQANNLIEAWDAFPEAMKKAMAEMVKELEKMNAEQKKEEESRIIVPGS